MLKGRQKALTSPNHVCWVAEVDGKIVGFCNIGAARRPEIAEGEVLSLYLLQNYKRQGIGSGLWAHAVTYFKKQPFYVFTLVANHKSRQFYEKMGGKFHSEIQTRDEDGSTYKEVCYVFNKS